MSIIVDARGLSCPQPVIMTKAALADKPSTCTVTVDNGAARENVTRFAQSVGYNVAVNAQDGDFILTITK